ncbi:unnamed protein product [Blepharisma stoltei]|uniref:Plasma membrane ATPase n=1 Tax=Blepharisma stoltei TaxID=1481888 RepID=A0AAU9KBS0_9CILI|nr:unnamed protein product [Blepharisma stoltei]
MPGNSQISDDDSVSNANLSKNKIKQDSSELPEQNSLAENSKLNQNVDHAEKAEIKVRKKSEETSLIETSEKEKADGIIGKVQYKLTEQQIKDMKTGPEGLTDEEAKFRFTRDGPNTILEKKKKPILKFLSYFWGPMPIMIWIAIIIEIVRLSYIDFVVLLILQFFNGFVGWYEERNAGNAIEALKKNLAPKAKVKRNNEWSTIDAINLVQGDRVNIKLGDVIPADCILGQGNIEVDQSAMTGESMAVNKYEGEIVYQGSICKRGELEAVVVSTGANTFFGKTSALVGKTNNVGNIQKVITKFTGILMVASILFVTIIFVVVLTKGNDVLETLSLCVVILVASIPIATQVVASVTLAVGAHNLARSKAIVSKLTAIEEMAGMQILCSDKTGTLTKNELTANPPFLLENYSISDIFLYAGLSSRREKGTQDAIDKCISESAEKDHNIKYDKYEVTDFIPFDPKIKRTEATVRNNENNKIFKCTKGAPQIVLSLCDYKNIEDIVSKNVANLASRGYRTIGVAISEEDDKWSMVGLIPLYDPPRDDTKETIAKALQMNLKVKMITGDQIEIAKETARLLNLGDTIYNSDLFSEDAESDDQTTVKILVEKADGFAEVFPEHKYRIVEILQSLNYRCGMTGDGVNDAPALKKANVGIAVEGATDAARAAASIVLTMPGLSVIIQAIFLARMVFQRMNNYFIYRIACTVQLLAFFFIAMAIINPKDEFTCRSNGKSCSSIPTSFSFPVIAIVLIAILNDGTLVTIAYDRVTVSKKPEQFNLSIMFLNACTLGFVALISSITLLLLCLAHMDDSSPNDFFQGFDISTFSYGEVLTAMYLKVALSDFFTLFSARTSSWFWTRAPSWQVVIAFIVATVAATLFSCYWFFNFADSGSGSIPSMQSISWRFAGFIWGFDLVFFIIQDVIKVAELHLINSYYKSKGKEAGIGGSVLSETFLQFTSKKTIIRRQTSSFIR